MASPISLKRDYAVQDGKVVVTETLQNTFTRQDLITERHSYEARQQSLLAQVDQLRTQYKELEDAKIKIDSMLKDLTSDPEEVFKI